MLTPVEMNLLYCQWFLDVYAMLKKQPQFLVGEVVGVDWKDAYQTVYDRWQDPTATNWRNWNVGRTQLGRLLKTFLPRLNQEMGVEIKTRGVDRHGHGVCQYYVETDDTSHTCVANEEEIKALRTLEQYLPQHSTMSTVEETK
jgi:hypothetical protein